MKQTKQMVGKLVSLALAGYIAYGAFNSTYQAGVRKGLEEAEQRSQRERIILTNTGYKHLADRDQDGKFDVLRDLECRSEISDTIYARQGHGPAQAVDSVVTIVEDDFFKPYQ